MPQILLGLLAAASAYASDVARKMEGVSIGAKEMRVLRFVHHPKLSYDQLLEAHIQWLSSLIGDKDNKGQQLRIYLWRYIRDGKALGSEHGCDRHSKRWFRPTGEEEIRVLAK